MTTVLAQRDEMIRAPQNVFTGYKLEYPGILETFCCNGCISPIKLTYQGEDPAYGTHVGGSRTVLATQPQPTGAAVPETRKIGATASSLTHGISSANSVAAAPLTRHTARSSTNDSQILNNARSMNRQALKRRGPVAAQTLHPSEASATAAGTVAPASRNAIPVDGRPGSYRHSGELQQQAGVGRRGYSAERTLSSAGRSEFTPLKDGKHGVQQPEPTKYATPHANGHAQSITLLKSLSKNAETQMLAPANFAEAPQSTRARNADTRRSLTQDSAKDTAASRRNVGQSSLGNRADYTSTERPKSSPITLPKEAHRAPRPQAMWHMARPDPSAHQGQPEHHKDSLCSEPAQSEHLRRTSSRAISQRLV